MRTKAFRLYTDLNWDDLTFIYDHDVSNAYADFYDAVNYFTKDSAFTEDIMELAENAGVSDIIALEELFAAACDS